MLNSVHLTNFRQHTDKLVKFNSGNTALRGENEAGKTTIIEAVMYLMGGTKRCRNSDFTTWGAKPSSTKVEGVFTFNGITVRATRGPKGAELFVPADAKKPTITGQNEVTAWFTEQFGAPLEIVEKMSFAGQKEIGGLLDEGNTKAVEFIEKMSGLDIVEWIIGQIEAKGECGPTGSLDDRIASQREQLAQEEKVNFADAIEQTQKLIDPLGEQQTEHTAKLNAKVQPLQEARTALRGVTQWLTTEHQLHRSLAKATEEGAEALAKFAAQQAAVGALRTYEAIEADLAQLREKQTGVESWNATAAAKRKFDAYVAPEVEWSETGEEGLRAFIAEHRNAMAHRQSDMETHRSARAGFEKKIAVAQSQKITSSACGLCGKDVSELPEVKAKNEALQAQIADWYADIETLDRSMADTRAAFDEAKANVEAGDDIARTQRFELALQFPNLFKIDSTFVPFRVTWIGPEIDLTVGPADLAPEIGRVSSELKARGDAEAKLSACMTVSDGASKRLADASKELAAHRANKPGQTEDEINKVIETLEQEIATLRVKSQELASKIGELQGQMKSLVDSEKRQQASIMRLKQQIAADEEKAARYQFNNDLIAALRRARPVVGNQLWSMILLSVSTYLSRMRGELSEVTREGKTFLINGKPYTSYSGSALDLLGLGIRIGLTKVFVPGADMLVLDEPFSACSTERTLSCLAFAASAGFEQTIVVTHESGTEEVFQNIVEI
jgi:DNA repair exonuclease SbcCD ATPase subunit